MGVPVRFRAAVGGLLDTRPMRDLRSYLPMSVRGGLIESNSPSPTIVLLWRRGSVAVTSAYRGGGSR